MGPIQPVGQYHQAANQLGMISSTDLTMVNTSQSITMASQSTSVNGSQSIESMLSSVNGFLDSLGDQIKNDPLMRLILLLMVLDALLGNGQSNSLFGQQGQQGQQADSMTSLNQQSSFLSIQSETTVIQMSQTTMLLDNQSIQAIGNNGGAMSNPGLDLSI